MTADYRSAGLLDPPDFLERLQQHLGIPGVARSRIRIEALPQADRVRREQEFTVALEIDACADRTWRVARQRNQHNAIVAEQISLAVHGFDRLVTNPIGPEIARRFGVGSVRYLKPPGVRDDRRLLEELVTAAVVGVQMRVHDYVDIIRVQSDAGETRQQCLVRTHDRLHCPCESTPALFGVIDDRGMTAGIEQYVTLLVPDQGAAHRQVDHLVAVGAGDINALLHAKPPGGEEVELHGAFPWRKAAALRIAATMF